MTRIERIRTGLEQTPRHAGARDTPLEEGN
jgi:hypothetical protein